MHIGTGCEKCSEIVSLVSQFCALMGVGKGLDKVHVVHLGRDWCVCRGGIVYRRPELPNTHINWLSNNHAKCSGNAGCCRLHRPLHEHALLESEALLSLLWAYG